VRLGAPHLHLATTGSTNAVAKDLGRKGAPHGTLVTAECQTAGRGRQGRSWWAPPAGAILASLVLRPALQPLLPLRAAVAIREAIGPQALIKWPNDLFLPRPDGRLGKVCGILGELDEGADCAVLGFGLNLTAAGAPPDLAATIAALELPAHERPALLGRILAHLERWLNEKPQAVLAEFSRYDLLAGREVEVVVAGRTLRGRARGLAEDGSLLLESAEEGTVTLSGGEVHLAGSWSA